jgi:threonine synthase
VLTDFLQTGTYDRNRAFHLTMSPSMDILISSNLERLLYFTAGPAVTADCMAQLNENGCYTVTPEVKEEIARVFVGYYADENETAAAISKVWNEEGYLSDTHTAVALSCADKYRADTKDSTPMVVASTASPYKFAPAVYEATTGNKVADGVESLLALEGASSLPIPLPLTGLSEKPILHPDSIASDAMAEAVMSFAVQ